MKTTAASLSEPEAPGPPPLQENRLLRECGCWSLNVLSGRVANTENSPGFEKLPFSLPPMHFSLRTAQLELSITERSSLPYPLCPAGGIGRPELDFTSEQRKTHR